MKTKSEAVIEGLQKKYPELKFRTQTDTSDDYIVIATVKDPNHAIEGYTIKGIEEGEYDISFIVIASQKRLYCETWDKHNRTSGYLDYGTGEELNNQYDFYKRINFRNTDEAKKVYNRYRTAIKKSIAEML